MPVRGQLSPVCPCHISQDQACNTAVVNCEAEAVQMELLREVYTVKELQTGFTERHTYSSTHACIQVTEYAHTYATWFLLAFLCSSQCHADSHRLLSLSACPGFLWLRETRKCRRTFLLYSSSLLPSCHLQQYKQLSTHRHPPSKPPVRATHHFKWHLPISSVSVTG